MSLAEVLVADRVDRLSARELEVLGLIADGLSNSALARRLFITERTVETHIAQVFNKLGIVEHPDSHRRVLVVLAYLRSTTAGRE